MGQYIIYNYNSTFVYTYLHVVWFVIWWWDISSNMICKTTPSLFKTTARMCQQSNSSAQSHGSRVTALTGKRCPGHMVKHGEPPRRTNSESFAEVTSPDLFQMLFETLRVGPPSHHTTIIWDLSSPRKKLYIYISPQWQCPYPHIFSRHTGVTTSTGWGLS